jgi:hypothetical protein
MTEQSKKALNPKMGKIEFNEGPPPGSQYLN